ncbi:hypothetical protein Salat_1124600 [Sesamum alatum]|uniref:Uncharacterized protein n=1 Tax=Sesamum alatum TaxID=300844 RepID=A0AAE1YDT8_9LAMI|nr:hypothetical protein Salat_1124600 [Sesamum alatum]
MNHLRQNVLRVKIDDGRIPNNKDTSTNDSVKIVGVTPSRECSVENSWNSWCDKLHLQNAQETKLVILDEVGHPIVFERPVEASHIPNPIFMRSEEGPPLPASVFV